MMRVTLRENGRIVDIRELPDNVARNFYDANRNRYYAVIERI